METKTIKYYDDPGYGFPVRILNAPMRKFRGEWILHIDQNKLHRSVLWALATKPFRLTGKEIRCIRLFFEMNTTAFGEKFNVSHPAVLKWEKAGAGCTGMNWSTEKDIRLFVAYNLLSKPADFLALYNGLEQKAQVSEMLIQIDARKVA
jgi:DNA-binding transcriptional regulator YiaG